MSSVISPPLSGAAPAESRIQALTRVARLSAMLARPSRQGRAALLLPMIAFAAVTALMLAVGGGTAMFLTDPRADEVYAVLGLLAMFLLAVPVFTLGAAAARLSSRNRDDRLATLRLLGATSSEVSVMTVLESAAVAAAGAVSGVIVYLVLLPLIGLLPFFGGPVGIAAVWAGIAGIALVVIAVIALATASATLSLSKVRLTPLGVRKRADAAPRRTKLIVGGTVALLLVIGGVFVMSQVGGAVLGPVAFAAVLIVLFGAAMAVINVIGAPILAAIGRGMARRARTAPKLIAGRELAEHAATAWRRVSSIAMISFIAVIGEIGLSSVGGAGGGAEGDYLYADIGTGVVVTLACGFIVLAASIGVTQAASVLEDRPLIIALDRLGMPEKDLLRARRSTVLVPLALAAASGAAVALVLSLPIVALSSALSPTTLVVLATTFVAGFALTIGALAATHPILRSVRRGGMHG